LNKIIDSSHFFRVHIPYSVTSRDAEDNMDQPNFDEPLAVLLERDLANRYGPMVANDNLRLVLGYASKDAFRQALSRKTVPVAVFGIENRRGKFALTRDVAIWLATQRAMAINDPTRQTTGEEPVRKEVTNDVTK